MDNSYIILAIAVPIVLIAWILIEIIRHVHNEKS